MSCFKSILKHQGGLRVRLCLNSDSSITITAGSIERRMHELLPLEVPKPIDDADVVVQPHQLPCMRLHEPVAAPIVDERKYFPCALCRTNTANL